MAGMWCRIENFRSRLSAFGPVLSSVLMLMFQLPVHAGQGVTLTWRPSSATNVAGYKIYYGTACHTYAGAVVVGNTTNTAIAGLAPGTTYFFAATTYDRAGDESAFSNEASYAVPAAAALTDAVRTGGQFSFTVSGSAGQQYVVEASTNLLDWMPVATNAAPFVFTDTSCGSFNRRFYRTFNLPP
jgi:hypothetical protein